MRTAVLAIYLASCADPPLDEEVVEGELALPDDDFDGVPDAADNCPRSFNPGQEDRGGIGAGSAPDGIGDACQCGDVSGDGKVTITDATLISRSLLMPPTATLLRPDNCGVTGSPACTNASALAIQRALLVPPTATIQQSCMATRPFAPTADRIPDDPELAKQYALRNVGQPLRRYGGSPTPYTYSGTPGADLAAPAAWGIQTDCSAITIAVIDTGIDYLHPELTGNMWINPGETGTDANGNDRRTNNADDDGNKRDDDWRGWDFADRDNDPMDVNGHGTYIAGIIGAAGNNHSSTTGLCWRASIMNLKIYDATYGKEFQGTVGNWNNPVTQAVDAIDYAIAKGARVINISWALHYIASTTTAPPPAFAAALERARAAGVVITVGAGNDKDQYRDLDQPIVLATNPPTVLSIYPQMSTGENVFKIASTDASDVLAHPSPQIVGDPNPYSYLGPHTVLTAAPGDAIEVLIRQVPWLTSPQSGTSLAAPHVAAAIALLLARVPSSSVTEIRQRVLRATDPLGPAVESGGRLDVYKLLAPTRPRS